MALEEAGADPGSSVGTTYWLISNDSGPAGALTVDLDGFGRTLPVFSFREEAELFLVLGGMGDG